MSRCFPYSPLRREEPLIESIKLQKEREKAKKKEKKEKRKDKKENKENVNKDPENGQEKKHRHKKRKHKDISLLQQKDDCSTKASNDAIDQLERSSLTEEHEMPIQKPESSEGSPDSNKKRKLPTTVNHSTNGTTLRIKLQLPMLRQKNLDLPPLPRVEQGKAEPSRRNLDLPPLPRVEQQGKAVPSRRNLDLPSLPIVEQQGKAEPSCRNLNLPPLSGVEQENPETSGRTSKFVVQEQCASGEQPCFSGRLLEKNPGKEGHKSRHCSSKSDRITSCSKEMKKFSELIMNWDAPKLQYESTTDTGDQDWLFSAPKRDSNPCTRKIIKVDDDLAVLSCSASSSCPPRACYVPEFDMYQLPYVIPF